MPYPLRELLAQLVRFAWAEARCCAFAVAIFAGLALSTVLPVPLARYDLLLLYGLAVTALFWAAGLERSRDLVVIAVFHVVGLVFELVKVRLGSWHYPEPALTKIGGVPLYSGFLYAAVASYVCRAWSLLRLRLSGFRLLPTALVAGAVYLNFFTHHWLPDLRVPLAALLVLVTGTATVHFTVGARRHRMPLALAFGLIGVFLWLAENIATFFGAWYYPHQLEVWRPVSPAKAVAWALLISVAFVLVAWWQGRVGRLHERRPA
ncbi:MAG TPA: DUF817 domain-containing protein [Pseudonocardiaceae bacterium]